MAAHSQEVIAAGYNGHTVQLQGFKMISMWMESVKFASCNDTSNSQTLLEIQIKCQIPFQPSDPPAGQSQII